MINLIPTSAKRNIVREYWIRVINVWVFLLSSIAVCLAALLIPTHALLTGQINAYAETAEDALKKADDYDLSAASLITASQQATELLLLNEDIQFSSLLTLLESLPQPDVSITAYEFNRTEDEIGPIVVSGIALTRQALADFRVTLLNHPRIETIELPISNLALDRDIMFTVTVTMESDDQ